MGRGIGTAKLKAGFVAILEFEAVVAGAAGLFVCADIEVFSTARDTAVSAFAALGGGTIFVFGASTESFFRHALAAQGARQSADIALWAEVVSDARLEASFFAVDIKAACLVGAGAFGAERANARLEGDNRGCTCAVGALLSRATFGGSRTRDWGAAA